MNVSLGNSARYLLAGALLLLAGCNGCGEKTKSASYFPESSLQAVTASRAIQIDRAGPSAPEIFVQMGHSLPTLFFHRSRCNLPTTAAHRPADTWRCFRGKRSCAYSLSVFREISATLRVPAHCAAGVVRTVSDVS
ncbi:MAG: hypothetical protein R6U29_00760 [Desulfosudaceae bacterium]